MLKTPMIRSSGDILGGVEPEDLLKFGLIPEFIGRLPVVATLGDLDEADLIRILTEPRNALVKQYQRLFELEGVSLQLADEALHAVADKALSRRTGARSLRSIMEKILLDTMFDLPGLQGVEKIVVNQEVVEGRAQPLYIYTKQKKNVGSSLGGVTPIDRCRAGPHSRGRGLAFPVLAPY